MARPLGLEFAGVLNHVTSWRDRREDIDLDEDDQENEGLTSPPDQTRFQLLLADDALVERYKLGESRKNFGKCRKPAGGLPLCRRTNIVSNIRVETEQWLVSGYPVPVPYRQLTIILLFIRWLLAERFDDLNEKIRHDVGMLE